MDIRTSCESGPVGFSAGWPGLATTGPWRALQPGSLADDPVRAAGSTLKCNGVFIVQHFFFQSAMEPFWQPQYCDPTRALKAGKLALYVTSACLRASASSAYATI